MALFGKLDGETISVLTSFYQLETTKTVYYEGDDHDTEEGPVESELDIWLYRNTKSDPYARSYWSEQWKAPNYYPGPFDAEDELIRWANTHSLIVRLMDAAAEANAEGRRLSADEVTAADLEMFNRLMTNAFPPKKMRVSNDQNGSLAITGLPLYASGVDYELLELLCWLLTEFVEAFNSSSFIHCEECKNVFAAIRRNGRIAEEKIYCSERCSTRARQKRSLQRKKEKLAA